MSDLYLRKKKKQLKFVSLHSSFNDVGSELLPAFFLTFIYYGI